MRQVIGRSYKRDLEDIDLSEVNFIRVDLEGYPAEGAFIDIVFFSDSISIRGSDSLAIYPSGGSNLIEVTVKKEE